MKHYQAIIISDLHLGTKDSKAEEFIEFLEEKTIYNKIWQL